MTDLGGLPATPNSEAQFINSSKQIVGESFTCDSSAQNPVAFLWENGSIVDLNTLISGNSQVFLYWSTFISNSGEIAAYGSLGNGDTHAFLLIPCDEEHPDVEGCDYSMVDATAQSLSFKSAARETFVPTPPFAPRRRNNRFRFPALVPTN